MAGTWEEKNTTSLVKDRLKALFAGRKFESEVGKVSVVDVKEPEGEAQIIFSKGKKKHTFDMNLSIDVEISLPSTSDAAAAAAIDMDTDDSSSTAKKKYKATVKLTELTPDNSFEWNISYKNAKSASAEDRERLGAAAGAFRGDISEAMKAFIADYRSL